MRRIGRLPPAAGLAIACILGAVPVAPGAAAAPADTSSAWPDSVRSIPLPELWPVLWGEAADSVRVAGPDTWLRNPARPIASETGGVVWEAYRPRFAYRPAGVEQAKDAERMLPPAAAAEAWLRAGAGAYSLARAASLRWAAGDTLGADSAWTALASEDSPWRWEALKARAELALARGAPALGDSLLMAAGTRGLSPAEQAERNLERARLSAAAADTAVAVALCRQVMRLSPTQAAAAAAVALLEAAHAARGESLSVEEERDAAEVDFWRRDLAAAARRLERAFRLSADSTRWRPGLRRAEVLRLAGRTREALRAWTSACSLAGEGEAHARCLLERARIERDARRATAALEWYARAAGAATSAELRETAWWERAREAEQDGRLALARAAYARVAERGGRRAEGAALRAGVLWYAAGNVRRARAWWERAPTEAARFWRAIAGRTRHRSQSDSLLSGLAALPGYSFYRVAARESLGVRGWPGQVLDSPGPTDRAGPPATTQLLVESELGDAAAALMARRAAGSVLDSAGSGMRAAPDPEALIAAAHIAYAAGRIAEGSRMAQRAFVACGDSVAKAWAVVPWAYPPAFESLLRRRAEESRDFAIDLPLLEALVWQESRFDPGARSRSDAFGLMQLTRAAALDQARGLHAAALGDSLLLDPGLNTRYGVRYLARLLERFGRNLPAALAAYNVGPGRVPARWSDLARRGGDALYCELIVFPETEDYVKQILAARVAYRELAPRAGMTGVYRPPR